jgi:putative ABC transport system permease protein
MIAVLGAVRGGFRRRVPTVVTSLVLLVSCTAAVLGLALAADSNAPFDHAFAAQRGADAMVIAQDSPAELAATGRLPEVTAVAGPFAEATVTVRPSSGPHCVPGPGHPCLGGPAVLPPLTLAGRAAPGGPVDDLVMQAGHWARGPGQVVLSSAGGNLPLGTQLTVTGPPGAVRLTVVGVATSVTGSADGWVTPATAAALHPVAAQMLYRFHSAGTAAAMHADVSAVAAALPPHAVSSTQSWLTARAAQESGIAPIAPFLVAFGVTGLVLSVLIVINVVSGAVLTGYRRIGILKSIGFTPAQVALAYTSQAMIPAAGGCLAGLVIGNLLAGRLLGRTATVYGVATLGVPAWVNVAVPGTLIGLTGLAAVLPAVRASRFSAVQAIAAGRAPAASRGYLAHRLLGRLRLPRPVTIGLAAPFARPARTVVTLAAVLAGATAVTLAAGLGGSLSRVVSGLSLTRTEQVQIQVMAGPGTSRSVPAALRQQPGTRHYVAEADVQASVAGLAQPVPVTAFAGNAAWTGYPMISGRWYHRPGQVDVSTGFLTETGSAVGDTVTVSYAGTRIPVRIAGQVLDGGNNGPAMITSSQTLARAGHRPAPARYDIELRPGTSAASYVQSLGARLGPGYFVRPNDKQRGLPVILGLISTLTMLLAAVAALGVLNTVVLHTRDRVHDLGVFKAVGMTPRQTVAMVLCTVAGTGLLAGLAAVPTGIALQRYLVSAMAAAAGTRLPASFLNVYGGAELAVLAGAGVVIAVLGALLPAGWAARASTAAALRAE